MPTIIIYYPPTPRAKKTVSLLKDLAAQNQRSLSSYLRYVLSTHINKTTRRAHAYPVVPR
jgi:hypothetical protein